MKNSRIRIAIVLGAFLLTALLYFAPQQVEKKEMASDPSGFSLENQITESKGRMKRQEKDQIIVVEDALKKNPGSKVYLDSLGKLWDRFQTPQISSYYYEEIAVAQPSEQNWINAAYRYFDAFKTTSDSAKRVFFVNKAIDCYKKVIVINPDNYDAKTDLGVCYAEGSSSPMQGIMLLREVVQQNPKHLMAQYNLGVLSVKSGQLDKAVERFKKVLEIEPAFDDARFLLGKTYMQMGNKIEAKKEFEFLQKNAKDLQLKQEVESLISQINNQ